MDVAAITEDRAKNVAAITDGVALTEADPPYISV